MISPSLPGYSTVQYSTAYEMGLEVEYKVNACVLFARIQIYVCAPIPHLPPNSL